MSPFRAFGVTAVALLACASAPPSMAQPPRGGGPAFGHIGGAPGPGGSYELLAREDVRKELELSDEQVKQLAALRGKLPERMREAVTRIREQLGEGGGRERTREGFRQAMERMNVDIRAEVTQILLPHQTKRLDQLALQMRLRGFTGLWDGEVVQRLQLTDQQRELLRGKVEVIERELRRKIAEWRQQTQKDLFSVLTPEQQVKFRELVGEPFEFAEPERRPAIGGPDGPPGGPGSPDN